MRPNRLAVNTIGVAFLALAAAQYGHAVEFKLDWSTLDGGGTMTSTAPGIELAGTIGQCDTGRPLRGRGFELTGGFWFGIGPGDCNWDGTLNLLDCDALADCVTGPAQRAGPSCICFDVDRDSDVDLDDFSALQALFNF